MRDLKLNLTYVWCSIILLLGTISICTAQSTSPCDSSAVRFIAIARTGVPYCSGFPYGDTAFDGHYSCHNSCDTCCMYQIDVINKDLTGKKIVDIQFCHNFPNYLSGDPNGCSACETFSLYTIQDSIAMHICSFCGTTLIRTGTGMPVPWFEWPNNFRIFPAPPSTTVVYPSCFKDQLCRYDCIHTYAGINSAGVVDSLGKVKYDTTHSANRNDTIRTLLGLTSTPCDTSDTSCIRVKVKFSDSTIRCCVVRVPRCISCNYRQTYWKDCGSGYVLSACDSCATHSPWTTWHARHCNPKKPATGGAAPDAGAAPDISEGIRIEGNRLVFNAVLGKQSTGVASIVDPEGNRLFTRSVQINNGENYLTLPNGSLPSGAYFFNVVIDNSSKTIPFTVIK